MKRTDLVTIAIVVVAGAALAWYALHGTTQQQHGKQQSQPRAKQQLQSDSRGDTSTTREPRGGQPASQYPTGYVPNPRGTQEFLRSLPKPTIRDAGPDLFKARGPPQDKPVLLYRALQEAYAAYSGGKEWVVGRQGIGDCVSWGCAFGRDVEARRLG